MYRIGDFLLDSLTILSFYATNLMIFSQKTILFCLKLCYFVENNA